MVQRANYQFLYVKVKLGIKNANNYNESTVGSVEVSKLLTLSPPIGYTANALAKVMPHLPPTGDKLGIRLEFAPLPRGLRQIT